MGVFGVCLDCVVAYICWRNLIEIFSSKVHSSQYAVSLLQRCFCLFNRPAREIQELSLWIGRFEGFKVLMAAWRQLSTVGSDKIHPHAPSTRVRTPSLIISRLGCVLGFVVDRFHGIELYCFLGVCSFDWLIEWKVDWKSRSVDCSVDRLINFLLINGEFDDTIILLKF